MLNGLTAQLRDNWDKTNDFTGRAILAPAGETLALLPTLANRQNLGACFDNSGNLTPCVSVPTGTFAAGNGILFTGSNPTVINLKSSVTAADYGVVCDGVTDDAPGLQAAINAAASLGGITVAMPASTCELFSNVFLNTRTSPGILTVPGLKIRGQGRGVTILDTHVANGYAISANPARKAAHQAAFGATVGTSAHSRPIRIS